MAGAAIRQRMRLEGQVELQYLQKHIDAWATHHPELVKQALTEGVDELWHLVRMKMRGTLNERTGKLLNSIAQKVTMTGTGVDAEVYSDPGRGALEPVKLRALEKGSYREYQGGIPYIWVNGKPRFISRESAQEGWPLVTKPGAPIRIRARPMFSPVAKQARARIAREVLHKIIEGFKRERQTVGV